MVKDHPWMLAGPWYRWTRPGVPGAGRVSAPALQKFAGGNFVNEFLKQPQHSLKFDPEVDQVFVVDFEPATLPTGWPLAGKTATLYPGDAEGNPNPSRTKLVPTGIRKLFLDTHSRHYLVVCELHCDIPGFPNASRAEVCQAGLVVRRHYLSYPESVAPAVKKLLGEIIRIQSRLAELDQTEPLRPRASKRRAEKIHRMRRSGTFETTRASVLQELAGARAKLDQWKRTNGVHSVLQGWVPGGHEHVGAWQIVEDEPRN